MAHKHSITDNPAQIIAVAAIAGLAGAVTALLTTPKSGAETRLQIRDRLAQLRQQVISNRPLKRSDTTGADDNPAMSPADETALRRAALDLEKHLQQSKDAVTDTTNDDIDHIRQHGER